MVRWKYIKQIKLFHSSEWDIARHFICLWLIKYLTISLADMWNKIYVFITYLPRSLYIFLWRVAWDISPYYTPLYYTLHTEHAYCLSYRFLNNVVITTVIEMVEMVEILDGRLGKRSVERVRYVINNLLHLVIVKYGDISLVLCISTRLRLVTILSLLMKYLVTLTRVISLIYLAMPPTERSEQANTLLNSIDFFQFRQRLEVLVGTLQK